MTYIDGINIGNIINQDGRYSSNEPLLLPNECGRTEIVKECFLQLIKFPSNDYTNELIGIINNNPLNNLELWYEFLPKLKGIQLTHWLRYAYKLQLIHKIEKNQLLSILMEGDSFETKKRLQTIINGKRLDLIDNNPKLKHTVFTGILNNELSVFERNKTEYSLNFLTLVLHPHILSRIFTRDVSNITFINHLSRFTEGPHNANRSLTPIFEFEEIDNIDKTILEFKNSIKLLFNTPLATFRTTIEPWEIFVENGRAILNENWSFKIIATIAAAIKSRDDSYDDYAELNNPLLSLCKRVRHARMKSGNIRYWQHQLDNSNDILFTLLVLFTWATPKAIIQLLESLSKCVKSLDHNDFSILVKGLSNTVDTSSFNKIQQKYIEDAMRDKKNYNEINYILSLRFNDSNGQKYIYNNIKKFTGVIDKALELKFQYLVESFLKEPTNISILEEIHKSYKNIHQYGERHYNVHSLHEVIKIPYEVAKIIMTDCKDYPRIISSFAERSCRLYANQHIKPVGEIANKNKWFEGN